MHGTRLRSRRVARTGLVALVLLAVQGTVIGAPPPRAPDQGLNANEIETAAAVVKLLTGRDLATGALVAPETPAWADEAVDMVVTLRDGAYWVYAKRGAIRFTRTPSGEGWTYAVQVLQGVNPVAEQDRAALATLEEEFAARRTDIPTDPPGCSILRGAPNFDENCRFFVRNDAASYPAAYERIVAEFDSARTGDIAIVPWNDGPDGSPGGHGHLGVTQSRATLLVSGRGARRTALPPEVEAALGIRHVDIAPTVAQAIGVQPYFADTGEPARTLNGMPSTTALLKRQDGRVLDELLDRPVSVFVVAVDGMEPEDVSPTLTPTLWSLTSGGDARWYQNASANMVSQTNANHVAMMTGASGEASGIVANSFFNAKTGEVEALDRPSLLLAETLFDSVERSKPWLRTAAVMAKAKLRRLFDCTTDASGACGPSSDNPEGRTVDHVRPDFLYGANESLDPAAILDGRDAPAEPVSGTGYALDDQVMDIAIRLQGEEDPDLTFINLGLVDATQHFAGAKSVPGRAALRNADRNLGRLVEYLKGSGKWGRSVVVVTADHSFQDIGDPVSVPIGTERYGVSNPVTPKLTGTSIALPAMLAGRCTSSGSQAAFTWLSHGGSASVYLQDLGYDAYASPALTSRQLACLRELRAAALAEPGVDEALYRVPVEGTTALLAATHPDWRLGSPRTGELVITAKDAYSFLDSPTSASAVLSGNHGGPSARPVPFFVLSGGSFLAAGVDRANLVRPTDIAPTAAWLLGLPRPANADTDARVLAEAFTQHPALAQDGPVANRAAIFIFDGNNSVDLRTLLETRRPDGRPFEPCAPTPHPADPVPNLRCLAARGTLTNYGSLSAWPSVTFPNHNTIGSGAYPGHNGFVNNRWYERATQRSEKPIDPTDPENPLYFYTESLLSKDVETLPEAVHRTFGDWRGPDNIDPTKLDGAFTASVNEPSARGADFASLEQINRNGEPAFAANWARADELATDTTLSCAQADPQTYLQGSVLDHIGQGQARSLFQDPTHPVPKFLINNFTLTDGAGSAFGPHTACALASYRDGDRRLGRVLDSMRAAGVLGETLIVVTGDHGMENQRSGGFSGSLIASRLAELGYKFVHEDAQFYFLSLDVAVSPAQFSAGKPVTVTVDVRDDDTGDPVGDASVVVQTGGATAGGTTPPSQAPSRFTPTGYPREISDALDDAEEAVGADLGDHPTIENPVRGLTDSSGRVNLSFTPACGEIVIAVSHARFNTRTTRIPVAGCSPATTAGSRTSAGAAGSDASVVVPAAGARSNAGGAAAAAAAFAAFVVAARFRRPNRRNSPLTPQ